MKDITAVNEWLADQGTAPLPVLVALAYAGFEAKQVSYRVDYQGGESPTAARVTVTLDGLLDDSVRGEEHVLEFRREAGGTWQLEDIVARVRCWPGRGSETFGDKPCV